MVLLVKVLAEHPVTPSIDSTERPVSLAERLVPVAMVVGIRKRTPIATGISGLGEVFVYTGSTIQSAA